MTGVVVLFNVHSYRSLDGWSSISTGTLNADCSFNIWANKFIKKYSNTYLTSIDSLWYKEYHWNLKSID